MVRPCANKKNCKVVSPKNEDCGAVDRGQWAALCPKVYSLFFCLQRPWPYRDSWLSFSSLLCFQSHFSHKSPFLHSSNDIHAFLESTQRKPFYFKIFNTITYVKILSPNFKIKSLCPINSLSVQWWFLNSAAPRTSRPSESYLPCRSACLLISGTDCSQLKLVCDWLKLGWLLENRCLI